MNPHLLGLIAVWLGIAIALALRDHFAMLREPDDGYVPRGRDSLFGCSHDWEITFSDLENRPRVCTCRRCGIIRHKPVGHKTWVEDGESSKPKEE